MKQFKVLSAAQMKSVKGGGGTCGVNVWCNGHRVVIKRNLSINEAKDIAGNSTGTCTSHTGREYPADRVTWCCDNC